MWVLGLGAFVYGQVLSEVFIRVAYGQLWVEAGAGTALRAYSGYVLLMALNGVIDAIGHAQSTADQLRSRGFVMIVFSWYFLLSIYLLSSMVLAQYGALGIIASNMLSYVCRIAYCVWLLRTQLPVSVAALLPERWTALSFACVLALSSLGPIVSLALLPQALLLYRCNRSYLLRAKQD